MNNFIQQPYCIAIRHDIEYSLEFIMPLYTYTHTDNLSV